MRTQCLEDRLASLDRRALTRACGRTLDEVREAQLLVLSGGASPTRRQRRTFSHAVGIHAFGWNPSLDGLTVADPAVACKETILAIRLGAAK